jgi:hypothetical protein
MNILKPKRDITGYKSGYLEVIRMEITPKSHGNEWRAICRCICGKETDVRPAALKEGSSRQIKSCGCMQWENRPRKGMSSQFKGYGEMNASYLSCARRRSLLKNWNFDLDAKFLWELYLKQNKKCALSGEDIFFYTRSRNRKIGNISLDRKDSKKGYTKDNVQWVHKDINNLKMEFDQNEFLNWCKKIVEYNKL